MTRPTHAASSATPEDAERARLVADLKRMTATTPAAYQQWGIQRVRAYKDAAQKATKLIAMNKPALRQLREARTMLTNYYPEN